MLPPGKKDVKTVGQNSGMSRECATFAAMKTFSASPVSRWLRLFPRLALGVLFSACDLIEYHPYDTRVDGEGDINNRHIALIEPACAGQDTIRFAVITDTQRWYDDTEDAVAAINAHGGIDFVIHCGDQSDFGLTKEFEWMRDVFNGLTMPYVCLIGNHDCLGTGGDVFRVVYGDPNFSFNAGRTHFVCLNTNAFEYDYSVDIPDFSFLRDDLAALPDTIERTVVAMHAQPYSDQFNNNVAEVFQKKLHEYPGLAFCVCGHDHHTQSNDIFGDGIIYYETGSINGREYSLFTLLPTGYSYEVVSF